MNVRVPIVKLYTMGGAEVHLDGESITKSSLQKFKYVYSEKKNKGDSAMLTLAFKTIRFDLSIFDVGVQYKVRWGYHGDLGPFREIAVSDFDLKYSTSGWTMVIKFVSIAELVSSKIPPGGSVKEAVARMLGIGLDFKFLYHDLDGNQYEAILLADGYSGYKGSKFSVGMRTKPSDPKERVEERTTEEVRYQVPSTYGENFELAYIDATELKRVSAQQAKDRIMGKFMGYINEKFPKYLQYLQDSVNLGYRVVMRDGAVINRKPAVDARPLFRLSSNPQDIISMQFKKASETHEPSSHTFTGYDAEGKEVTSIDSTITKIVVSAQDLGFGPRSDLEYEIYRHEDGYWYSGNPEAAHWKWNEAEIQAILEKIRARNSANTAMQKIGSHTNIMSDENWLYKVESTDADTTGGLIKVDFKTGEQYQKSSSPYQDIIVKDSITNEPLVKTTVPPGHLGISYGPSTAEELNKIINAEKDSLFYQLEVEIQIEGNPTIITNQTILLTDISPNLDGRYYVDQCEHELSRSGFITTIIAYHVDYDEDIQKAYLKQKADEKYREFLKKYVKTMKMIVTDVISFKEYNNTRVARLHSSFPSEYWRAKYSGEDYSGQETYNKNVKEKIDEGDYEQIFNVPLLPEKPSTVTPKEEPYIYNEFKIKQ